MQGSHLTNNTHAGWTIGALIAAVWWLVLGVQFAYDMPEAVFYKNLEYFEYFAMGYVLFNYWFSPDLDVFTFRPGHGTFPFGPLFKSLKYLRKLLPKALRFLVDLPNMLLGPVHVVFNTCWRVYWQGFASLFTHRCAVHIPVVGTFLKSFYVAATGYILLFILSRIVPGVPSEDIVSNFAANFWVLLESKALLQAFVFGAIASDTVHIGVDAWDSIRNGTNFIPPANIAPRGLLSRILRIPL